MRKKISLGVMISFMAIACAITFSLTYRYAMNLFNQRVQSVTERQGIYEKLNEVDQKIRENYFGSIDEIKLMDSVITGYVDGIGDTYGYYMSAEEYKAEQADMAGNNVGIGAAYVLQYGKPRFTSIYAGSPASIAGLQKGDILLGVDDVTIAENGLEATLDAIKTTVGEKMVLHINREGKTMDLSLTVNTFEVQSVQYRVLDNAIGCITISEFNDNTDEQFIAAVSALRKSGVQSLILDVRNNPGGTLDSVAKVLDVILPAGNIVSQQTKNGTKTVLYTSDANHIDLPIAVLTNQKTASAAELLACAIQDYDAGVIFGETTYGKGTMQRIFPLSDGSALNLTVAKFYPPVSDNFDGVGVTPDYTVRLGETQIANFYFLTDDEDSVLKAAANHLLTGGSAVEIVIPDSSEPSSDVESNTTESDTASGESATESGSESDTGSKPESDTSSDTESKPESTASGSSSSKPESTSSKTSSSSSKSESTSSKTTSSGTTSSKKASAIVKECRVQFSM